MVFKKAFLFFAFVLSALLAGCRGAPLIHSQNGVKSLLSKQPMPWTFACDFDSEENRDMVRLGFKYWDDMTRRDLFQEMPKCGIINPAEGEGVLVKQATKSHPNNNKDWITLAYVQRYVNSDGLAGADLVFMPEWDDDNYSKDYQATVRHEVGHILGLNHFPQKRCLMNMNVGAYEEKVPPEDGWVKGVCQEELELFHIFYGN